MKRRTREVGAGSLDMLLDTMCNTFGGVCFIALLVAILSAMLPKDASDEEEDVRRMAVDETVAELVRKRDEFREAVKLKEDLLHAYETNATDAISAADVAALSGDKDAEEARLRKKLVELEEQIKTAATATEYNEKEHARLMKLSDELKRKLADFKDASRRTVRTPTERNLSGWGSFDVWIRHGDFFELHNPDQCSCEENGYGDEKTWDYRCIPGKGFKLDDAFLQSEQYRRIIGKIGGKTFVRIFADPESFPALCRLRDDLIRRGFNYNWRARDVDVLGFVSGIDNTVQ